MWALCAIIITVTVILAAGYAASRKLETEEIKLAPDAAGIRIVHISDTHFPDCFVSSNTLEKTIKELNPDCIVFTGDIADGNATREDISALGSFFNSLSAVCPCYLVIGNHEIGSEELNYFVSLARKSRINVLLNEITFARIKNTDLAFIGLSDGYKYEEKTFPSVPELAGRTKILLTHRPEKFDSYIAASETIRPDIVFSGHAHGGLFRIGKSALYAPNQGLFPKYTSGLYEKEGVKMIVSRGLGVSGVDFRCFNKYHIPIVTLP